MTQLSSTASMFEAHWKMWLLEVFAAMYLAAVCAAQDDATATTQTIEDLTSTPLMTTVFVPPEPVLELKSDWLDVFTTEKVELKCTIPDSSDWAITWLKNNVLLSKRAGDESVLTLASVTTTDSGSYTCRGRHKTRGGVDTKPSNSISVKVTEEKPKPTVTRSVSFSTMYPGESLSFTCTVSGSSGWDYVWYHNGTIINSLSSITIVIAHSNSGEYYCKAKRGQTPFYTEKSETLTLQVSDPPTPTLTLQTKNTDVFITEAVEFSCQVSNPDWTFSWYRDSNTLDEEGSSLKIPSVTAADKGHYACKAHLKSRSVFSEISNKLDLKVYSNSPKPTLTRSSNFNKMYPGESISFTCHVAVSSGWEYMWYHNEREILSASSTYSIPSTAHSNSGKYYCKAKRGPFSTDQSEPTFLQVSANSPKPTLNRSSNFNMMYPGESISFTCRVDLSSGWEYMWYHNGSEIQSASSTYNITSVAHFNSGEYYCKAKRGPFSTDQSEPTFLQVSDPPTPYLKLLSSWSDVFQNELLEFSCIGSSPEWTFTWYKDSDVELNETGSVLKIPSVRPIHQGKFDCKAHLTSRGVTSGFSNTSLVKVYDSIPQPTLSRKYSFDLMYVGETVEFTCNVDVSSGWEYQWYKDENRLSNTGNTIRINLDLSHKGKYSCIASRGQVTSTGHSKEIKLDVQEIPVPTLNNVTQWLDVFPSETAKLRCQMQGRSGWTFTWYKDAKEVKAHDTVKIENDGSTLSIKAASASHHGNYKCSGKLKDRSVRSNFSSEVSLHVYDAEPTVTLMKDPEIPLMHTDDSVSFSCHINVSSGWNYLWYKDGNRLQGSKNHHNISHVKVGDSGSYKCEVKRGKDKFISKKSQAVKIEVHERPQASIILLTGWTEVFSTDSLVLKCEVENSPFTWNYTWFKEEKWLNLTLSEKHTVTPHDDPEQSLYFCKGIRNGRPTYSKRSEALKTKNLLLKRRILLSISGCIFFGIIAVFLGCIVLRVCRKPAADDDKTDDGILFPTMAQLKDSTNAPCPLVEYITDADLNVPPKEGEEDETVCSETTPLPITSKEDQAVTINGHETTENGGGMVSFKH